MTQFVLDTSVTLAWFFEDEATPQTDAVLDLLADGEALVPALWRYEVTNVLLVALRRDRATHAQATRFLALVDSLPIQTDSEPVPLPELLGLASEKGLTAYDGAYLLLAERTGAPLATVDTALARACTAAGVDLLIRG